MFEDLKAFLGCPCTELPAGTPVEKIMEAYQSAKARSIKEGFVPLLISAADWEEDVDIPRKTSPSAYLKQLQATEVPEGKAFFQQRTSYWKEEAEGDSWPDEAVLSPMEGGEAIHHFLGIANYQGKTIPLVLAEIPAEHPWEVFAWMPFGGWNECPSDGEHIAAAKYWYKKYGAVPAVITRDVLEYDLSAPVKREEAMELAMEQYAFCPDIVDQGCESVGYLADSLSKSTKWFFWWD
ncbi:MAG: DUF4253 domain-containing protein [Oscillibacter sp.]|nr:DUF4253 domain-containing protein [Oscillibacter sp.]